MSVICPTCQRPFNNLTRTFGPPVIRCSVCNTLVKTGLHRVPSIGDKMWAGGGPIIIGLGWIIFSICNIIQGGSYDFWRILIGSGGFIFIYLGWDGLKKLDVYAKSVLDGTDEIPTW